MSSRTTIALGAALLLLGLAGFGYLLARPRPQLVPAPPEPLPLEEPRPSPTPESTPQTETPEIPVQRRLVSHAQDSLPRLTVELLRPGMADTFTAPANVTLSALAYPHNRVRQIAFYHQKIRAAGESICRSLTKLPQLVTALTERNELGKLSEVNKTPYEYSWTVVDPGIYRVLAVATFDSGLQQMSASGVIVVNAPDTNEGRDWIGWRPHYPAQQTAQQDPALMPSPTPTPSCPTVTVESSSSKAAAGSLVTFRAAVTGGDSGTRLRYNWIVIGGEVVSGKGTPNITVAANGVAENEVTASVEVNPLSSVCRNTALSELPISQPVWMNESARNFLQERKRDLDRFAAELKKDDQARGYVLAMGESDVCVDRASIVEANLIKNYLVDLRHLNPDRLMLLNGSQPTTDAADQKWAWALEVVQSGANPTAVAKRAKPLVACRRSGLAAHPRVNNYRAVPINRKCPNVDENIRFTTLLSEPVPINICPYNPRDPGNDLTHLDLGARVMSGNYGNYPSFRFWTNAGRIAGNGQTAIWDLSEVKLRPGIYSAIAVADDDCDCATVNATQVNVTNFCRPCLKLRRTCESNSLADSTQSFVAKAESFARQDANSYQWETTAGKVIAGQGSNNVAIDTRSLAEGTEFVVTVSVGGLQRYCVNRLSYHTVVGSPCPVEPRIFDEFGATQGETRRAKRRPPPGSPGAEVPSESVAEAPQIGDPEKGPPSVPGEKEWMKVAWSPKVKTDDSFAIVVTYDRTTEKVKVSDQAGETAEALNLAGAFKLLKDKYGPDHRALANIRFDSAGLDVSFCREQYQSLDNPKVEWSCSVSPKKAGNQTFNLELWARAESRKKGVEPLRSEAEKVWSKNNLKVEVSAPILTKTTVFASASLCVVLGLGFSLRWLKIYNTGDTYNVGHAVAVGRNVTMTNTTVNQNQQDTTVEAEKKE